MSLRDPRVVLLLTSLTFLTTVFGLGFAMSLRTTPQVLENTPENALVPTSWPDIRDDLDVESLIVATENSLSYLRKLPAAKVFHFGPKNVSVVRMVAAFSGLLSELREHGLSDPTKNFLRDNFEPLRMNTEAVLMTGYYVPELRASKTETPLFSTPLYRKPGDLITVKLSDFIPQAPPSLPRSLRGRLNEKRLIPYFSREQISFDGVLKGQGLEVAWTDDPIEAFFLQIQGSGELHLPDGSTMYVGYEEQNGQPYRAIGRLLIDQGILPRDLVSKTTITQYLREHPEKLRSVLSYNTSYVFMREIKTKPAGDLGVEVTAGRTIATDRNLFPPGALALLTSTLPVRARNENDSPSSGASSGEKDFTRFVLNQDTGGAIRGPGRIDLFIGKGAEAGWTAGSLKNRAQVVFFAPR